jgi:hypothetical protein
MQIEAILEARDWHVSNSMSGLRSLSACIQNAACSPPVTNQSGIMPEADTPAEHICPISLEVMVFPVLLVETGQVYDRDSIE